jgi:hypothetical protein
VGTWTVTPVTAAVLVAVVEAPAVTLPEAGGGAADTVIVCVAGTLVPAELVARSVTEYVPAVV